MSRAREAVGVGRHRPEPPSATAALLRAVLTGLQERMPLRSSGAFLGPVIASLGPVIGRTPAAYGSG